MIYLYGCSGKNIYVDVHVSLFDIWDGDVNMEFHGG